MQERRMCGSQCAFLNYFKIILNYFNRNQFRLNNKMFAFTDPVDYIIQLDDGLCGQNVLNLHEDTD
jgi:hypothetical protein